MIHASKATLLRLEPGVNINGHEYPLSLLIGLCRSERWDSAFGNPFIGVPYTDRDVLLGNGLMNTTASGHQYGTDKLAELLTKLFGANIAREWS